MAQDDGGWGSQATEEQDFAFDGGEYSRDDIASGDTVDKEGWYHFEIVNVKNDFETLSDKGDKKSPCVVFTCNVLAAAKGQSAVGSKLFHRIYVAGKGGEEAAAEGSVKSALRFGLGIGLLEAFEKDGREVIVDASTKQTRIPASIWQRAMNRQFVSKVVFEKGTGNFKDKYAIPFGRVYHPLDPSVADAPKDMNAVAMLGGTQGAPPPPPPAKDKPAGQQKPPAQQQQKAPPPAKPADDDFSDL